MAELVVERPGGRDRGAETLDQLSGQVLGGGLAGRAGDARDRGGGQRVDHEPGQRGQGGRDVANNDRWSQYGGDRDGPGREHRDRAGRDGGGGEVVPVDPFPRDRGEQAAGAGPPGVDHHLAGHHSARVPAQLAVGALGDLGQGQRDHRSTAHGSRGGWPLAARSNADAVTARSSKGSTAPATYCPVSWPLPATTITSPGAARPTAWAIAAARSGSTMTRARSSCGTLSTPSSIAARMANGSSDRGLSLVRMATSASDAAAAPIIGRLARSRSPPQPSTMIRLPRVTGRSERSTASTAPGLCE